ncbi:hypothetical protein RFI_25993 [Reticulomyxa filosa]|uniref:Kelch motif family protein n=1 Tax=Reticulomyxa filosa TaxID=46433 RepID=X6MBM2_RETFI|nr:hypothetical protein RFI_25993 [Reticulomyxa filosa]|eukprot:ETO11383.1 hypothetical protein RFI_25993 [Reticulomyxa filosa]
MSNQIFQTLKELATPLRASQCVLHKHELLICGGYDQRACYSYHILKNEYKLICEYPSDVQLNEHCVIKLKSNRLLSFGGNKYIKRYTLLMKYVSVWDNISNKFNNYNQWIPFTDDHNHPIIIGMNYYYNYEGVRAVIGGSNNHLLFITCYPKNIHIFDLNRYQFIKHDTLPILDCIGYHCFVLKSENKQEQEMMKTNEKNKIIKCCYNNSFQFHQLLVCNYIAPFNGYSYVCINDIILFFGGFHYHNTSKLVHKYLIQENKWKTFQNTLPSPLFDCIAILNEEYNNIHIIGGQDNKRRTLLTHMKTKIRIWDVSHLVMICLFILMKNK